MPFRQHSDSQKPKLTTSEAERRVWEAADKLIELIGDTDPSVREHFARQCISLLTRKFHLIPPDEAPPS